MCVIAPSFADIFHNNMFQNGLLPIALAEEQCRALAEDAEQGRELEVDLEKQEVRRANGQAAFAFRVDPFRRTRASDLILVEHSPPHTHLTHWLWLDLNTLL